jgi:hypothetical protein
MRALALLLPTASLLAIGCDADCGNPARLDGRYQVESNTVNDDWSVTGFDEGERDAEVAHLHGVFANGPATWNLKHVPADDGFRVTIDGQQYTATYTPSDANCNSFELSMSGAWSNPEDGATHQFTWVGDLVWTGDELGGTFEYRDEWGFDGRTGTVEIPSGEMRATIGGANTASTDTGR